MYSKNLKQVFSIPCSKQRILGLLVAFFIIPLTTNKLHATTIVVYVTADFVYLGVDGKMGFEYGKTGEIQYGEAVKIFEAGNYFFSASGVLGKKSNLNEFFFIIGDQIKKEGNLNDAIAHANLKLQESLSIQAEDIKTQMPDYYNNAYLSYNPVFTYVIVGLEEGKPFAYVCRFTLSDENTYQLETAEKIFSSPNSKKRYARLFLIGSHSAIDEYLKNPLVLTTRPRRLVIDLLKTEIRANPDKSGLPLNIVKINKNGKIKWVKQSEDSPIKIQRKN